MVKAYAPLVPELSKKVLWRWVRGHNGHPQNEYANELATRAAADQSSSSGAVASGFDAWLAKEREHGRLALAPDALPDPDALRPARSLPQGTAGRPS